MICVLIFAGAGIIFFTGAGRELYFGFVLNMGLIM